MYSASSPTLFMGNAASIVHPTQHSSPTPSVSSIVQDIASIRWEEDDVHQQDDVTTPAEDPVTDGLWWMHLDTLQEHTRGHAHFLVIMGHYYEAVEDSFPSLRTCTGLVLKQSSAHTYQRIGIFDTRPGFDSDIGNPPVRQVTII